MARSLTSCCGGRPSRYGASRYGVYFSAAEGRSRDDDFFSSAFALASTALTDTDAGALAAAALANTRARTSQGDIAQLCRNRHIE